MSKILIRAAQNPLKTYGTMESTRLMGGNSGNLLYANGVARALSARANTVRYGGFTTHRLDDPAEFIRETNDKYDHYVMPMSNMFRASFTANLKAMTRIVRDLDMPVTIVGAGAQTTADAAENDEFRMARTGRTKTQAEDAAKRHNDVVRMFCEAILEKSHSMGVRGEFTQKYLVSLGLPEERIRVIGCPSIFTWGPEHRVEKKVAALGPKSSISMNIDYRVPGIERVIDANMAQYRNLTSPSQDAKSARMIITGEDQYDLSTVNLGTPVHTGHPLFARRNVIYYPNPGGGSSPSRAKTSHLGHGYTETLPQFLRGHQRTFLRMIHGLLSWLTTMRCRTPGTTRTALSRLLRTFIGTPITAGSTN